jgi:hypothetical protein
VTSDFGVSIKNDCNPISVHNYLSHASALNSIELDCTAIVNCNAYFTEDTYGLFYECSLSTRSLLADDGVYSRLSGEGVNVLGLVRTNTFSIVPVHPVSREFLYSEKMNIPKRHCKCTLQIISRVFDFPGSFVGNSVEAWLKPTDGSARILLHFWDHQTVGISEVRLGPWWQEISNINVCAPPNPGPMRLPEANINFSATPQRDANATRTMVNVFPANLGLAYGMNTSMVHVLESVTPKTPSVVNSASRRLLLKIESPIIYVDLIAEEIKSYDDYCIPRGSGIIEHLNYRGNTYPKYFKYNGAACMHVMRCAEDDDGKVLIGLMDVDTITTNNRRLQPGIYRRGTMYFDCPETTGGEHPYAKNRESRTIRDSAFSSDT